MGPRWSVAQAESTEVIRFRTEVLEIRVAETLKDESQGQAETEVSEMKMTEMLIDESESRPRYGFGLWQCLCPWS